MKSNYEQSSSRTFLEYSFQMKWHHEQYKPVPQSCAVLKEKWLQQMLPKSSKDWFMYSHNCTFISETVYHIVCQILIVQLPAKIFSLFGYCTHWMTSRNIQNGGPQVWSYFLFFYLQISKIKIKVWHERNFMNAMNVSGLPSENNMQNDWLRLSTKTRDIARNVLNDSLWYEHLNLYMGLNRIEIGKCHCLYHYH